MPIVDLLGEFNSQYPESPTNVEQRCFYFNSSPDVFLIDEEGQIVENYELLPQVNLSPKEQELLSMQPEPKLNEPQILVTAVKFENGKLFVQAYKSDYKFLVAYGSGKVFPKESPIYTQTFFKTVSIAALITNDNKTVIVERNDALKLFSSFSGFLNPEFIKKDNVATATAIEEAQEEFFAYTNINIDQAEVGSLSFRKGNTTGKFGTVEFIVKLKLACNAEELIQALDNHLTRATKPDGQPDHTGRYKLIDLGNLVEKDFEIEEPSGTIRKIRDASFFLVDPIVNTLCNSLRVEIPNFMQNLSLNEIIESRLNQEENKQQQQNEQEMSWVARLQSKEAAKPRTMEL